MYKCCCGTSENVYFVCMRSDVLFRACDDSRAMLLFCIFLQDTLTWQENPNVEYLFCQDTFMIQWETIENWSKDLVSSAKSWLAHPDFFVVFESCSFWGFTRITCQLISENWYYHNVFVNDNDTSSFVLPTFLWCKIKILRHNLFVCVMLVETLFLKPSLAQ